MQELFRAHDLNENGLLEELELIQLNKKMAMLHYGKDADLADVSAKYKDLFRSGLDPEGEPVPYATFRRYMAKVLTDIDPDRRAQIMIMEQFIAEALAARSAFHLPSLASVSDLPFIDKMRLQEDAAAATKVPIWDRGMPASLGESLKGQVPSDEKEDAAAATKVPIWDRGMPASLGESLKGQVLSDEKAEHPTQTLLHGPNTALYPGASSHSAVHIQRQWSGCRKTYTSPSMACTPRPSYSSRLHILDGLPILLTITCLMVLLAHSHGEHA